MADGVFIGEIPSRESLIHDNEGRAAVVFVLIPDAALRQGDSESGEVFAAYKIEARGLILLRWPSGNLEGAVAAVGGRGGVGGERRNGHAGHFGNLGQQLLEVGGAFGPGFVGTVMDRYAYRHDVVRIVAERDVEQADESFNS